MSADQSVNRNIQHQNIIEGRNIIAAHLEKLYVKGNYLIKERPSSVSNNFFIELEKIINDFYNRIYDDYISEIGFYDKAVLLKIMEDTEENILPPVSAWSDYAKNNPESNRPEELFAKCKRVGRKLADLKTRL